MPLLTRVLQCFTKVVGNRVLGSNRAENQYKASRDHSGNFVR
ncbi:MAG: hypothetical protein JWP08_1990 [Bryobacterales bacterium]|nr:hypothetical protein [Bryobacterales bacterium]